MAEQTPQNIVARMRLLEEQFLACLTDGSPLEEFTQSAADFWAITTAAIDGGALDNETILQVHQLALRIRVMSLSLSGLEDDYERIENDCMRQTKGILSVITNLVPTREEHDPFLPLRLWFLDHISNPYPNTKEKDHFKTLYPKHTKAQLDTWFTNVRRRSGWQDLKRRYTDGSLADFLRLLEEAESPDRSPIAEDARKKIEGIKMYLREGVREKVSEEIQEIVEKGAPKTNTKRKVAPRQRRERLGQLPSTLVPNDPKHSAAFDLSQFQTSLVSSPASLDPPQLPTTQPRYPSTFSSPTTSLRSVSNSSSSSFDSLISYDSTSSFASISPSSPPASSSLVDFNSAPTSLPPLIVPSSLPRPPQHQPVPAPPPIDNPYFFTLNNTPLLPLPDEHADIVVATSSLAGFATNGDLVV
ncbi:hypothetical protein JCM16303_002313 [Sporobolomyces ruberrimus]